MTEQELSHLQERIKKMGRWPWQKLSNPSLNSNAPAYQQLWKCSCCVVQMQLILSEHPANQSVWGTRMRLQEGIQFASGEQIKTLFMYLDVAEFCSIGKALEKTDGRGSQCQCISTHSKFIPPKTIQDVRLSQRGPHCKNVEIMWALFLNSILPPTGGHFSPYLRMHFQWKDVSLAKPQGHNVLGMRLYIQRNELIPSQCYKQLPDSILNLFLLLSYLRPTSEGRIRFPQHRAQLIT